jgi:putative addiction module component (TIGR02574 family)
MTELNEILKLSPAERILMIEKIWNSINHEKIDITNAQVEETERRLARYKAGKTKFFSWEEIKRELHS